MTIDAAPFMPGYEGPYIGTSTGDCIGNTGMGCYGSLSPVSETESLSNWNESLCVEMSRYEITRVVGPDSSGTLKHNFGFRFGSRGPGSAGRATRRTPICFALCLVSGTLFGQRLAYFFEGHLLCLAAGSLWLRPFQFVVRLTLRSEEGSAVVIAHVTVVLCVHGLGHGIVVSVHQKVVIGVLIFVDSGLFRGFHCL
jgi:hypothetical protein